MRVNRDTFATRTKDMHGRGLKYVLIMWVYRNRRWIKRSVQIMDRTYDLFKIATAILIGIWLFGYLMLLQHGLNEPHWIPKVVDMLKEGK